MKKVLCMMMVCLLILSLSACGSDSVVGRWHSEITISVLEKYGLPDEFYLASVLTGDKLFDIYVQFNSDGTYIYDVDTSDLEEALSQNVGAVIGLFTDYDASDLVKDLIAYGLDYSKDAISLNHSGTYRIDDNGKIATSDGIPHYFTFSSGRLCETDLMGNEHFVFTKM